MSLPIPLAAAMLVSTVVSTGAQVAMGMANASAQEKVQRQQIENANIAAAANYDEINLRRRQERQAAAQQMGQNRIAALRTTERFRVAADEAGVSGNSVEAGLRDLYGQEARYDAAVQANLDITEQNLLTAGTQVQNRTKSAIAQAQPVDPVPWATIGANLVRGVGNAYMMDSQIADAGGNTLFF